MNEVEDLKMALTELRLDINEQRKDLIELRKDVARMSKDSVERMKNVNDMVTNLIRVMSNDSERTSFIGETMKMAQKLIKSAQDNEQGMRKDYDLMEKQYFELINALIKGQGKEVGAMRVDFHNTQK